MNSEKSISNKKPVKKKIRNFWVWLKYFSMKWRFRLDQARSIFGLITFALILAQGYVTYLPWIEDPTDIDFWIVVVFAIVVFIIFIIGGYLYDRLFKMWTETTTVTVERNPYTYVPSPKEQWNSMALYGYLFNALAQIAEKLDIKIENEEEMKLFLNHYLSMDAKTPDFEKEVEKLKQISNIIKKSYIGSSDMSKYEDYN